jgi:GNAT superfamily N-acetyltransferase
MTIEQIELETLPDPEAILLHDFFNEQRKLTLPDDPPIPLEERLKWWREPDQHSQGVCFWSKQGNTIQGYADVWWRTDDTENPDMGWLSITVAPSYRRQGIGTHLACIVLEAAQPHGRRKLFTHTTSIHVGGKPFAQMLGAKLGQEEHTNQLLFSELNQEYYTRVLENAPRDKFEIGYYDNDYPESELEALCRLFELRNTAPRGDLEFNDWKLTPEKLREEVAQAKKHNSQFWMLWAKDKITGEYAGFTETGWHHNREKIVPQYGTTVHPDYRGHGLGAWLKAEMIRRIRQDRPSVDRIRTGNADSNVPMLKINHNLGFKPFFAHTDWQVFVEESLERIREKLSEKQPA